MTKSLNIIGPCGIFCGICECYSCKDNSELLEYLVSRGINREKLPCAGCREIEGNCPAIGSTCETYTCAKERKVDFCYECSDFPCSKLNPAADRADVLPHNTKVFNLCCIRQQGVDKFLERASNIKKRYYTGKMVVGKGPQID